MNINLNQTLLSLCDAYHAGKITKAEYRLQRSVELDKLSEQAEAFSEKPSLHSEKWKKHIMVSAVLVVFSIIVIAVLVFV